MTYLRRNVYDLGGDWAPPILWYARGVKALKARALKDRTSWRFYGAIHGIDPALWELLGWLGKSELTEPATRPAAADIRTYWSQCQHGSWYFLPWHRGYLLAFEALIRDAVTKLGGPADWALPYWNYFEPRQNGLPPAFATPDWPDGKGDNPLHEPQRYGPRNDRNVYVLMKKVNLRALGEPDFTGTTSGGSPGFGGVDTKFSHGGQVHGRLERQPHDQVHGLVGGSDPDTADPGNGDPGHPLPGLMSDPDTAGLDPIFWLHHGNIDRLWEVWLKVSPQHADPGEANWLGGPASVGDRAFAMPKPDGTPWTYTPAMMARLSTLGYGYDDVSAPAALPGPGARIARLATAPGAAAAPEAARRMDERVAMSPPKPVELLGASRAGIPLVGAGASTAVTLDAAPQRRLKASLAGAASRAATPDRVFLNLENVRGLNDATTFDVYIDLPAGADPDAHPDNLAGSVSLFGVRKASRKDGEHGGNGVTFVLDVTHVVDALHIAGKLDAAQLHVSLVPLNPVPAAAEVTIGRISVFRQGD